MQIAEKPPQGPRTPRRTIHKFDPLGFAKDLQATGFTREQAEGLAARMSAEQSAFIDDRLAHEEDIAGLRTDIEALRLATEKDIVVVRADIQALRISMDAKIETTVERTKAEILKWMFGQTIVIIVAVMGLMRVGAH